MLVVLCIETANSTLEMPRRPRGEVEVYLYSFCNLGAGWRWVVNATPRLLYPWEREPVPIAQKAVWASGLFPGGYGKSRPYRGLNPGSSSPYHSRYTEYAIPAVLTPDMI
jgi:hypothetical protein